MTFKEALSAGGRATLGVLLGLQLLDSVDNAVFAIFTPEIRESLGVSSSAVSNVGSLTGVMVALAALPLGVLGDRRRRTTIAGVCTLAWALAAALLGMVQNLWQAAAVRILAGIGKANEGPIQISILTDAYPPAGRGRVLGVHRGAQPLGVVAGPAFAALVAAVVPEEHEPWRWAYASVAVVGLLLALATLRLREPVRGRFEREAAVDGGPPPPNAAPVPLRVAFARLRKIRTFHHAMLALGAFGLCVTTVPFYLSQILGDQLGQGATTRSVVFALCSIGGLVGATLGGVYGDRLFRRNPKASLHLAGGTIGVLGTGLAVQAYAPDVTTFVVVGMLTQALVFGGIISLSLIVAAVVPPVFRATAFALVSLYLAVVGGLGGALATTVVASLWGQQAAVAVVAPVASAVAGLVLIAGAGHLRHDIAQVDVAVRDEQAQRPHAQAARPRLPGRDHQEDRDPQ
ncbi:sugar phosphate permease [Umezawaea tangerina]|uniref:Sugar phosphate permease n=2 Tax=Umezawaea tangerina TaxID=84725 RepID=A0A2T0STE4_9PSEU|nr:sugar phosphate permease [Umezawaea tangerina]